MSCASKRSKRRHKSTTRKENKRRFSSKKIKTSGEQDTARSETDSSEVAKCLSRMMDTFGTILKYGSVDRVDFEKPNSKSRCKRKFKLARWKTREKVSYLCFTDLNVDERTGKWRPGNQQHQVLETQASAMRKLLLPSAKEMALSKFDWKQINTEKKFSRSNQRKDRLAPL